VCDRPQSYVIIGWNLLSFQSRSHAALSVRLSERGARERLAEQIAQQQQIAQPRVDRQIQSLESRTDAALTSQLNAVQELAAECRRKLADSPLATTSRTSSVPSTQLDARVKRVEQQLGLHLADGPRVPLGTITRKAELAQLVAQIEEGVSKHVDSQIGALEARLEQGSAIAVRGGTSNRTEMLLSKQLQQLGAKLTVLEDQLVQLSSSVLPVGEPVGSEQRLTRTVEQSRTLVRSEVMQKIMAQDMRIERIRNELSERLDRLGHKMEQDLAHAAAGDLERLEREVRMTADVHHGNIQRLTGQANHHGSQLEDLLYRSEQLQRETAAAAREDTGKTQQTVDEYTDNVREQVGNPFQLIATKGSTFSEG
jgi:hypothetical protein